ncbi:MAG: alanine racemase [Desulfobacteraceae bacterium]|nr:MAG: alanine racemase [Desulfobacteraceae bacterium]
MTHRQAEVKPSTHPVWAEIDLSAIAHNTRELRRLLQSSVRLLVAVKANGYGHGAEQVARTALRHGATDLGVARITEGLALRRAGISAPILIFGYTPAHDTQQLLERRLVPSIFSLQNAREIGAAAASTGQTLPVHVKVDTGMGRLGLPCDGLPNEMDGGAVQAILEMSRIKGIQVQGVFTHFATADHADLHYARRQLECFMRLLAGIEVSGLKIPLRHAANSGAILQMPETHMDMVRAGISVYGLYPSAEIDRSVIHLRPALSLKSAIIHLKRVPAGTCISYGCTYRTPGPTTIATVPVGYADGYRRGLSNKGFMLARGTRVPVVGRVCMDLTMIDVGRVTDIQVGDEVVLIGRQMDGFIAAEEVAAALDTISYEVVAGLTERVARVYLDEGGKQVPPL